MAAFVPGVEGLQTVEWHLLRGDALIGSNLKHPRAAIHSKVPRRQADLIVGVGLQLGRVLEARIVAKWSEVFAAIVVMVLDNLRLLLGDVARLGASLLIQPLLCR